MKFLERYLRRRPRVQVGFESDAFALFDGSGAIRRHVLSEGKLSEQLKNAVESRADADIDVAVEAGRVQITALPWARQLNSPARWKQFAAARFQQVYGAGRTEGWTIRMAERPPPHQRAAVAVATSDIEAIKAAFGKRLGSVRVAVLDRLDALLKREPKFSGCVICAGSDSAWILVLRDGELQRTRRRAIPSPADDEAIAADLLAAIRTEWAGVGQEVDLPALAVTGSRAAVVVSAATATAVAPRVVPLSHRETRGRFGVDLLRSNQPPRASWALLGLGLGLLAVAGWNLLAGFEARQTLVSAQSRVDSALAETAVSARAPASTTKSAAGGERRDAQRIARELHRPWATVLDGLEVRATPAVRLVQMNVDPRFTQLQLQAEAKSLADVLQYAQRIAEIKAFQSVQLVHHEWKAAPSGRLLSARLLVRLSAVADVHAAGDGVAASPLAERTPVAPRRELQ